MFAIERLLLKRMKKAAAVPAIAEIMNPILWISRCIFMARLYHDANDILQRSCGYVNILFQSNFNYMMSVVTPLIDIIKEIFSVLREFLPKVFHVCLWALTGVFILPCVFIANHFFPMWVKWGEDF